MKILLQILLLSIYIMISSCGLDLSTPWEISMYQQKIEDSKLKIVSYSAWGGLDSHISDKKIMLSTVEFDQDHVGTGDNFTLLGGIPNGDTIKIIEFDRSGANKDDKIPEIVISKIDNTTIKRYIYSYRGSVVGPCTYKKATFDKLIESKDSIHFFNCISSFADKRVFGDLSFPKGNIYLEYKKDSSKIDEIRIELLLLREDKPLICRQSWSLEPVYRLKLSELSERGIFR